MGGITPMQPITVPVYWRAMATIGIFSLSCARPSSFRPYRHAKAHQPSTPNTVLHFRVEQRPMSATTARCSGCRPSHTVHSYGPRRMTFDISDLTLPGRVRAPRLSPRRLLLCPLPLLRKCEYSSTYRVHRARGIWFSRPPLGGVGRWARSGTQGRWEVWHGGVRCRGAKSAFFYDISQNVLEGHM